jgi:uncharacterized pyridoxamine 5'-phosphate oxidase family protein
MTKKEILAFLNENPVFFLATAQGNAPFVRGMMTFRADESGIYFCTEKAKDIYRQLAANPAVELCFYSPATNFQVRIRGSVEPVLDLKVKKEVVEKFPFLKPWIEQAGYGDMAVFRLSRGAATTWSMQTAFAPKDSVPF